MVESTAQDVKIEQLRSDVDGLKTDVLSFRDHVVRCDERQERREKAEAEDRKERKEREARIDKYVKWVGGALIVWLLGVEGHQEATNIITAIFGG